MDTAFLPYPTILVGIGLQLRSIQICVFQIYIFLCENIPIDVRKYIFDLCFQAVVHKIADRHVTWRGFLIQQPQKADVCLTQFLNHSYGAIAILHKRKQYYLQQLDWIILWAACIAAFLFCNVLIQVNMLHHFVERIYRIRNFNNSFHIHWHFQLDWCNIFLGDMFFHGR